MNQAAPSLAANPIIPNPSRTARDDITQFLEKYSLTASRFEKIHG